MNTIKILHITPHLGGGVGKVLNGIVKQSTRSKNKYHIEHRIICLEQPERLQFINDISKNIIICPSIQEQNNLINNADIIQLELFDSKKPTLIRYLQDLKSPLNILPIRLIIWYHNNGLYDNFLPDKLIKKSHIFLFTSQCSFQNKSLISDFKNKITKNNLDDVFSSGGFENIPEISVLSKEYNMSIGCFKHLNPNKIHPDIDKYLKSIENNKLIYNLKIFETFTPNIIEELKSINIILYLLHPLHYGCSENLLLECMAMGIVPIVLDNPAEKYIIENGKTGLIIKDIEDFKCAIKFLYENPLKRQEIGLNASRSIRKRFSIEKTESKLNYHYNRLMKIDKEIIKFNLIQYNR